MQDRNLHTDKHGPSVLFRLQELGRSERYGASRQIMTAAAEFEYLRRLPDLRQIFDKQGVGLFIYDDKRPAIRKRFDVGRSLIHFE